MEFGVFIPGHWMDHSKSAKQLYDEMLIEAVFADQQGFDNVWLAEHYAIDYIAIPGPIQMAASILERTDRIKAGVAVLILRNHHPIKLAAEISQIDVMYGGRFECVLGRGASDYEFVQMERAMDVEASKRYYREHLEIMAKLWKSRKSLAHHGEFFNFDNTVIMPPPHTPEPPFYLAGIQPASIRQQVDYCHQAGIPIRIMNSAFREDMSYVQERYDAFTSAVAELGVSRKKSKFAVNRVAYLAETDEEAWEIMPTLTDLHRGLVRMLSNTEIIKDGIVDYSPVANEPSHQQMFDNCLIGSPDTVRKKVRKYAELGIDHLIAYVHLGQPHDKVMRSMKLFAEEVLPEFRNK
ncbi:MAG: LLM class flavin-dependent oxidoreductase [Gammaproteobacteria bacterium]|nr:MAG: LLM class flavin-dependent oxidoreductase [Gammaproteobacteria bacterium]